MPIESQEAKITVQVKVSGYPDVQALKDICFLASNSVSFNPKLFGTKKYERMKSLINEIGDLP